MLFSEAELAQMALPCQEVKDWLAANPRPPPADPPNALESRANLQAFENVIADSLGPPPADITETEEEITMRDGTSSAITIYKPSSEPSGGSPLFVLFFGGGFIAGSRLQFVSKARTLVKLFGAVCVCVSYRRAPEHKFPAAQMDCWDHLKWVTENASSLGARPEVGFVVGGISAGANIAAALTRRSYAEEPLSHRITGQWLDVPPIFGRRDLIPEQYQKYWLSREQCANGPLLRTVDVNAFAEATQWDPESTWMNPTAYPNSYKDMPPSYFSVNGADPLRDDALIYEEILKQDGVRTKLDLYRGYPHGHAAFMVGTAVAHKATIDSFKGAAWLLGKDVTKEEIQTALPVPVAV